MNNNSVLIFTFSPVQSFIAEARRASDLFAGSALLVQLAQAAGEALITDGGELSYPAGLTSGEDVPNKIVARVPWEAAQTIAQSMHKALYRRWRELATNAYDTLRAKTPAPDKIWDDIWKRQIGPRPEDLPTSPWEIYWAAQKIDEAKGYAEAYRQASVLLMATKRTRAFPQAEEDGPKDSLSGRRSALHTATLKVSDYWAELVNVGGVTPAQLRPDGRERLDAIGAIKRFGELATHFASTSAVASSEFLARARQRAPQALRDYRKKLEAVLGSSVLFRVNSASDWPYDGDWFYAESLQPEKLRREYKGKAASDPNALREAEKLLKRLHKEAGGSPHTYYAILLLDGDSMGEQVNACLSQPDPPAAHRALSERVAAFAQTARAAYALPDQTAELVYNGGDDVLALSPLVGTLIPGANGAVTPESVLGLSAYLAGRFADHVSSATASAGVAIVHHTYPLDAALRAARQAEKQAKQVPGKNAVCAAVLRRSGEITRMRSGWGPFEAPALFDSLVSHFANQRLSSKFVYDLLAEAPVVTHLPDKEARAACLKRLLKRHAENSLSVAAQQDLIKSLCNWANTLDPLEPLHARPDALRDNYGFQEVAHWAAFARFVAQGGRE